MRRVFHRCRRLTRCVLFDAYVYTSPLQVTHIKKVRYRLKLIIELFIPKVYAFLYFGASDHTFLYIIIEAVTLIARFYYGFLYKLNFRSTKTVAKP